MRGDTGGGLLRRYDTDDDLDTRALLGNPLVLTHVSHIDAALALGAAT